METRETILQELESISPAVASLERSNVFAVPAGYFDQLPAAVLSLVKSESQAFGEKEPPFSVPAGYFENFAGNILNKIRSSEQSVEAELAEIAPVLNTISKQPVYTVPQGYFESLEHNISLQVVKPTAKVVQMGKTKRLFQLAVAACTAGILIVGAYLYSGNNTAAEMPISYKEAVNMNVSTELDKISDTDLASYIETTPNVGYALNVAPEEINFDEYLDAASDEEINEYLNETAEPAEVKGGS